MQQLVLTHLLIKCLTYQTRKTVGYFFPRINRYGLRMFSQVGLDFYHGIKQCGVTSKRGFHLRNSHKMPGFIVFKLRKVFHGGINNGYLFLVSALDRRQPQRDKNKCCKNERHQYGKQDKRLFAYPVYEFTLNNNPCLVHN